MSLSLSAGSSPTAANDQRDGPRHIFNALPPLVLVIQGAPYRAWMVHTTKLEKACKLTERISLPWRRASA